jgi:hypothetical protein
MTDTTINSKLPEPASPADLLAESIKAFDPGLEDDTVIRFKVRVTPQGENGTDHLTLAALWVDGNWYTTGRRVFEAKYDHADFMKALARMKAYDIVLATDFDVIR